MSATVSMAAGWDRSGSCGLLAEETSVCQTEKTPRAAFVKYDPGATSPAAHLLPSHAHLSLFSPSAVISD